MSNVDSIKTYENLSDNVQSFDSKEQFMRYYDKNKEAIDAMHTRGINTKFKINGFKIGRKNKELIFYSVKPETNIVNNTDEINDLNMKLDVIIDKINKIEKILNHKVTSNYNQRSTQSLLNNPVCQQQSFYTSAVSDIIGRTVQN